jgi:hypothetical protein
VITQTPTNEITAVVTPVPTVSYVQETAITTVPTAASTSSPTIIQTPGATATQEPVAKPTPEVTAAPMKDNTMEIVAPWLPFLSQGQTLIRFQIGDVVYVIRRG